MSLLEAGTEGVFRELDAIGIDVLWHPSTSEQSSEETLDLLHALREGKRPLDLLCVEGCVVRGPSGTGRYQMFGGAGHDGRAHDGTARDGAGRSMMHWIEALAARAGDVVAIGSCAAFGGVPAAGENLLDACGLQFEGDRSGALLPESFVARNGLPVVNISGCAPHPGWMMETFEALVRGELRRDDLDGFHRPRFFTDHLAHHGCNRNEFYEFKASARVLSARGCLMEDLGCKATQAAGDCNMRLWNGSGSCTNAGYACIDCTAPGFEGHEGFMQTPKVAGIPVGLPSDMPKAWFVALAALSKSATPRRVRTNAESAWVVVPPVGAKRTGRE